MELNIISNSDRKTVFVSWIEVETVVGGMVVQLGHAPSILELKAQSMISYCVSSTGKVETIDSATGFIDIGRSRVNILMT